MPYPKRALAAVTAMSVVGAVAFLALRGDSDEPADGAVALGRIATVSLTLDQDCDQLLTYYRKNAARIVGPYGFGGPWGFRAAAGRQEIASAVEDSAKSTGGGAPPDSSTNVQVAGVDESDVVKTSGDLMVAVVEGEVRVTRLAGAGTRTLSSWKPFRGAAQSVLLDGATAVVIGDRNGVMPLASARLKPGADTDPVTVLTVLDLSDPAAPLPVREVELDGTRSGEARLVAGELRLAVTAGAHGIRWRQPDSVDWSGTPEDTTKAEKDFRQAQQKATAANRRIVAASTIENWIPQVSVSSLNRAGKPTGSPQRRPLLDCRQVAVPGTFSGLETLAMVSMNLRGDDALTQRRAAGVIAAGSTLYATADRAWVATSRWGAGPVGGPAVDLAVPPASDTQIHLFETRGGADPKYVASGEVKGSLLNQFALDERGGVLRVASTTEGGSTPDGEVATDDSDVATDDGDDATDGGDDATGDGDDATQGGGGAAGGSDPSDGGPASTATDPKRDGSSGLGGSGDAGGATGSGGAEGAPADGVAPAAPVAPVGTEPAGTESPSSGRVAPQASDLPLPLTEATTAAVPGTPTGEPASDRSADPSADPEADVETKRASEPASGERTRLSEEPQSEARITTLRPVGERLEQVGLITGMGKGEQIRGVRFVGDIGYVVTYRQTDPLYTVDLRDPANPTLRGELAVLGYSAYLHPAGDGRLLGLGQDGTEEGQVTGLQLSLFDVSDLGSPRRLDRERLAGAWSDAEADHHAFTMAGDLVLIPYTQWTTVEPDEPTAEEPKLESRYDAGVIAVRIGADGIGSPNTLRPLSSGPVTFDGSAKVDGRIERILAASPLRTVVHDGVIYTLTASGVAAHDGSDFRRLAFARR